MESKAIEAYKHKPTYFYELIYILDKPMCSIFYPLVRCPHYMFDWMHVCVHNVFETVTCFHSACLHRCACINELDLKNQTIQEMTHAEQMGVYILYWRNQHFKTKSRFLRKKLTESWCSSVKPMRRVIHVCLGSGCSGCDWGWGWCILLWTLATFRRMDIRRLLVGIIQIPNLLQLGFRSWDRVGLGARVPKLGRSILRSSLDMRGSKWV